MNSPSPLEAIFFAALEKGSPQERAAYLDEACAGAPDLRGRIEKMLAAQAQAGSFLEQPARNLAATIDEPGSERPGTVIGPYKLLQQIGEGGMGAVFMAEQTHPVQRKVALKIIRPGTDSRQVLARFEAERQALALMDHPNIAKVLDVGKTDSGRPYFVMELVKGVPITKYCDEHHLTPRERLELFLPVCHAVQHAHQKGIIHRDLKPYNVLVAEYDDKPVTKIIDFGVAKATGPKLTDRTMFTELGQVVGTLEYMSPEQAKLNALDIDTRSDVYALGVVLYELLTGTTPFQKKRLRQAAFDEVLRIIREEEPPKPSTRLSTTEELPSIAANRNLEPKMLSRLVRGELDWIVMKCLEKDRNRRYETANGLARDLERYLHDEPVQACPPSAAYRFRKLVRRNKALFAMITVVGTTLLMASAAVTWKWREAESLRKNESEARAEALASAANAKAERQQAVNHLYRSLVREARATRLARRMGYRTKVFGRLCEAKALDTPERDLEQLRQEAVACLGDFVGLEPTIWEDLPAPLVRSRRGIAVSPDGRFVAFALQDETIRIRDAATGAETGKLNANAWGLLFGPDAHTLFGRVGNELKTWKAGPDGRWALARSRKMDDATQGCVAGVDQYLILSGGNTEQKIEGFAWEDDKPLGRVPLEKNTHIDDFYLTHDRKRIVAVGSKEGKSHLFLANLKAGRLESIPWVPADANHGRVLSWDGRYLASVDDVGISLYDLERRQHMPIIRGTASPLSACFTQDGRYLLFGTWDGHIHFWSLAANHETARLSMPGGSADFMPVLGVSEDGRILAVGAVGRASEPGIRLWNLGGSGEKVYLAGHDLAAPCVAFSPDGRLLASGSKDHRVEIWDAHSGAFHRILPSFQGKPQELVFSRDGRYLFVGELDAGGLTAWTLDTFRPVPIIGGPEPVGISGVALSPDGLHLAVTSYAGGGLRIYQIDGRSTPGRAVPTLQLKLVRHLPGRLSLIVRFSPNGKRLAWTDQYNNVCVYDFEQSREVPFPASRQLSGWYNLNWYPDSAHLAFVSDAKVAEVWNVATGERAMYLGRLREFQQPVSSLSPDGRWFVSNPENSAAVIWDARTGKRLLTLPEESGAIWCYAWSPDCKRLALSLTDGGVVVWDLARVREQLATLGLDWTDSPPGDGPAPPEQRQPETPMAPLSLKERADAYFRQGDLFRNRSPRAAEAAYRQALRDYEAIELDSKNPVAWNNRGRAYLELGNALQDQGKLDAAIACYHKAIDLDPKFAYAHYGLGNALRAQGKLDEAIAYYHKAIEIDPKFADPHALLGFALELQGKHDHAMPEFRKAMELNPKEARSAVALMLNNLAWDLATNPQAKSRDPKRAVELAQKAVELAPKEGNFFNTLGATQYRTGNWKAAIEALDKSRELRKGGDAFDFFFLAMAYCRLGQKDDALKWYKQAVEWVEKNSQALADNPMWTDELRRFRAEAEELMEMKTHHKDTKDTQKDK